jgi:hypothetical protein
MDSTLWDLSESYSFDHVLYAHDIAVREPTCEVWSLLVS